MHRCNQLRQQPVPINQESGSTHQPEPWIWTVVISVGLVQTDKAVVENKHEAPDLRASCTSRLLTVPTAVYLNITLYR